MRLPRGVPAATAGHVACADPADPVASADPGARSAAGADPSTRPYPITCANAMAGTDLVTPLPAPTRPLTPTPPPTPTPYGLPRTDPMAVWGRGTPTPPPTLHTVARAECITCTDATTCAGSTITACADPDANGYQAARGDLMNLRRLHGLRRPSPMAV